MAYWDETSEDSLHNGIPWALTDEKFDLDGETIDNPLRSFVFPRNIADNLSPFPDADYSKPKGYETVRYPLSGLVGEKDIEATRAHNAQYPDHARNVALLNANIVNWLNSSSITIGNDEPIKTGVHAKFRACLDAPNYTVFSNTTSASEWNANSPFAVPLESPHNSIHLAVGGFDVPNQKDFSPIEGANGDMGENDTAGLDPIFFFHHCFIDRVFWLWQKRHGATDALEIMEKYPGTNSVDGQGPTPGSAPNSWLTLDSPLDPFRKEDGGSVRAYTSRDCINIETQLGYTYGPGSLEDDARADGVRGLAETAPLPQRAVHVSGISRARIRGSFLITAFANVDGKRVHLGTEAVLSRWHVEGCANCQTHLQARAVIPLPPIGTRALGGTEALSSAPAIGANDVEVEVHTRDGLLGGVPRSSSTLESAMLATGPRPAFRVEVR